MGNKRLEECVAEDDAIAELPAGGSRVAAKCDGEVHREAGGNIGVIGTDIYEEVASDGAGEKFVATDRGGAGPGIAIDIQTAGVNGAARRAARRTSADMRGIGQLRRAIG